MSDVGIVTLYKDNFGSILQCYSTKRFLQDQGITPVVFSLDYEECKLRRYFHILYLLLRYKSFRDKYFEQRKMRGKELSLLSVNTKEKMNEFIRNEICPYYFSSYRSLKEKTNCLNSVIVGSDQVWNLGRPINRFFLLDWVPNHKKIAFGPSFGFQSIPPFNRHALKKISKFPHISVREESAQTMLQDLFPKKEIVRVGDPTIMLNKDEWIKFASNSNYHYENFVLLHFLNEPTALAIESVKKIANGKKIICICNKYSAYSKLENIAFLDCNPYDYVKLISTCDCLLTDSFHSTLFSINLNKHFLTFHRQYLHSYDQTSRITDMLKRFHLEDHYIESLESIDKVKDFLDISNILEAERNGTKKFLLTALEDNLDD